MRRPMVSIFLIALTLCLIAVSPAINAKSGNSLNAKLCYKDGWQTLMRVDRTLFLNEGECTSYGAQGGTILEIPTVTPTSTVTNTPTNIPTNTPVPPTNTPSDTPTNIPIAPTNTPTDTPTNTPTVPTNTPTQAPTATPTTYVFDPQFTISINPSYCDPDLHVLIPRQVVVSGTGWRQGDIIHSTTSGSAIVGSPDVDMFGTFSDGSFSNERVAHVDFDGGEVIVRLQGEQGGDVTGYYFPPLPADLGQPTCQG